MELSEDGRITLHHSGAEMGTGMSTSQSVLCAQWLGKPADEAHFSVTDWSVLPMVTSGDPLMSQEEQDKLQTNQLDAELLLAVQRQQLGLLLLAQHPRSGAPDFRSRPVAGGDGVVAGRYRRRPGGAAGGAA